MKSYVPLFQTAGSVGMNSLDGRNTQVLRGEDTDRHLDQESDGGEDAVVLESFLILWERRYGVSRLDGAQTQNVTWVLDRNEETELKVPQRDDGMTCDKYGGY
jgi:hypothetical protein